MPTAAGPKDTSASLARQATYTPSAGFPFRVRNLERIWAELQPDADPHGRDEEGGASTSGRGAEGGRSGARVIDVEVALRSAGGEGARATGTGGAAASASAAAAAAEPPGGGVRAHSTCSDARAGLKELEGAEDLLERLRSGRRLGAAVAVRLPMGTGFAASGLLCSSRLGIWAQ